MNPILAQNRRFRAEWMAVCLMLLFVASMVAWTLYRDHVATQAQEGDRLQTQARVIDENLIRQLEGADKALAGFGVELKTADLTAAATTTLTSRLKLVTDAMPGISSMLVLDAGGTIVAASRDNLIGKNFSQRAYFDVPKRGDNPATLYVSPPFRSTLGTYVMVVSRVLQDGRGQFIGVITATLDPDYFNVVLRSVLYAPDMRTTLIHRDGKVFLNMPPNEAALGLDLMQPASPFSKHLASGQVASLTTGVALTTGEDRIIATRDIDRPDLHIDKPIVVWVSRAVASVYAPWRARCWQLGALFAVFLAATSTTLFLNQRRRRASGLIEEAVARERQVAAERVEIALRGADLGLWDLQVTTDHFVINARERQLLGFGPDDALPQGAAWRDLIHPDDRDLVGQAILPHLLGQADTYGCEHRMEHRDGHYVWLSSRAMIVERSADGSALRIVGTHLDISERKRNEERLAKAAESLRDSEEELRLVSDNMPALVSRLDRHQRFRFANRAYSEWLQIEPASLLGKSLRELYGEDAYRVMRPHVERALAGEKVVYEREMMTPDGMRQVEVTLAPQLGQDGEVKGIFALIGDITARHCAELQRARSEERLSLALEGSSLALFDWDVTTGILYHSAQAAAMRGDEAVEVTAPAEQLQAFIHPDDLPSVLTNMKAALTGTSPGYHVEFRLRRKLGDWLWVRARGRVVERDAGGRAMRLAGTYADINDRKMAEKRLRRLAEVDMLTGLPNRAVFGDRLSQAMARSARGKPMALLFLDVDHFKHVNDTLGHEAGDQLLKVFASRMQGAVRQSDTVARLAGDEFTIILEAVRDAHDATMVAGKLVEALREPIMLGGKTLQITASIGIAICVPGESDEAALLRRADNALYEAKRRGRDGFHCAETATEESVAGEQQAA